MHYFFEALKDFKREDFTVNFRFVLFLTVLDFFPEQVAGILTKIYISKYSLGMKDSWGPMKALAVASVINGVGDVVLCLFLGYGIAGAVWATMVS